MISKERLVGWLKRPLLTNAADELGIWLPNRREVAQIRKTLMASHEATVKRILETLPLEYLRRLDEEQMRGDEDSAKKLMVQRLLKDSAAAEESESDEYFEGHTRSLYLTLSKCDPPSAAVEDADGQYWVEIDLLKAFHGGYTELHGHSPGLNQNPLWDEYGRLLAKTHELRFIPPGIGADPEARQGESQRLGRVFARAYLHQHLGYRWFASFRNLRDEPWNGWSASPAGPGNSPDWLVAKAGDAALAEAKGTHDLIEASSTAVRPWRKQLRNARVQRHGQTVSLEGWLVATRWVTTRQPHTFPNFFVEDPEMEGRPLGEDDWPAMERWVARYRTVQNLLRLGREDLAYQLTVAPDSRTRTMVQLWRCVFPGLEKTLFIGTLRAPELERKALNEVMYRPDRTSEFVRTADSLDRASFFDGLDIRVVKSLLNERIPPQFEEVLDPLFGVSLLSDGSLLAPLRLMVLEDQVEL
jgi:hypothetical protein